MRGDVRLVVAACRRRCTLPRRQTAPAGQRRRPDAVPVSRQPHLQHADRSAARRPEFSRVHRDDRRHAKLHLDLGTQTDQHATTSTASRATSIAATAVTWPTVAYTSTESEPRLGSDAESDCARREPRGESPCTIARAAAADPGERARRGRHHRRRRPAAVRRSPPPRPRHRQLPAVGGLSRRTSQLGTWDIFGSAAWDLSSNELRTADWTLADAAGFPILPLLLKRRRGDERRDQARAALHDRQLEDPQLVHVAGDAPDGDGTTSTSLPPIRPAVPPQGELRRSRRASTRRRKAILPR